MYVTFWDSFCDLYNILKSVEYKFTRKKILNEKMTLLFWYRKHSKSKNKTYQ